MQNANVVKIAVSAGLWTLLGHGSSQVLRLVSNLLLTRLLAPESFGVMSVAVVVSLGVHMFSDLGLRQVIIQSREARDPRFVNTVWTIQVLQSLLAAALLVAMAGGLAYAQRHAMVPDGSTYASGDLPPLIAGLALGALISGFESTSLAAAEKEMSLRPVIVLELGSQVVGLLAMCAVALMHPSVYVLLVGALVSGVAKLAGSHLLRGGVRNRLEFNWEVALRVRAISGWIIVSSALSFLSANLDKLVLAGLLGSHAMGQFAIASLLVGAANAIVTRLSSRVAFPAITKAYERDGSGLVRFYYRSRRPLDAFCFIVAATLFWFGDVVVRILYDGRYAQAGSMLGILALTLLGSRYSVVPYVYLLLGRANLMAAEQGIRLVGLVVAIGTGYHLLGAMGAVWGVALGQLAGCLAGLLLFQPRLGLVSLQRELTALALFAGVFGLFGLATH